MKNPCKDCPNLRTSRCRDCESRIAYNAFKREESRWTRQQNDLASQEESRLRGKRPKAKKARPRVDETQEAQVMWTPSLYHITGTNAREEIAMRLKNRSETEITFAADEVREALLDYLRREMDGRIPEGKARLLPGNTGLVITQED